MDNKCICINQDKEEYTEFGKMPECAYIGNAECNTLEYYLATEWSGDRIVFAFSDIEECDLCHDSKADLYSYAKIYFDERSILNSTPKYRYILNLSKEEYYDKEDTPKGSDGSFFEAASLLLSAESDDKILGFSLGETEKANIGKWIKDKITVTNDISAFAGFKRIIPMFKRTEKKSFSRFAGKNVVITGTLKGCDRVDCERLILKSGGFPQTSVTRATDYLVVASKPGKIKLDKARKYGTAIIDEDDFFNMLFIREGF